MHPVLRSVVSALLAASISHTCATSSVAQAPAKLVGVPVSSLRFASDRIADPSGDELQTFGEDGTVIERARVEVMSILTEENSCSAWFRSAEPEAAEKFRSLRFTLDESASGEIKRIDKWQESSTFYQPYVAHTGQNVGWGSTITINAKGAFFKDWAPVRVVVNNADQGYVKAFRQLAVGNFSGGTREARILTLLHELGHVLDLLPIDSGVPSGPQLSTQNTSVVLQHCGAQIRHLAKHPPNLATATFLMESPLSARVTTLDSHAPKR
ncbi:MAG TPA: hypothetical protein VKD70_18755 [Candidatus Acidoferrum sp.]|nr:hypothetical protein [Candidatus Acidoferrum sp.]